MRVDWVLVVVAIGIVLVVAGGTLSFVVHERGQADKVEACSAAGMEWVRDSGSYYECRVP